jgi:hypothetical protein
MYRHMIRPLFKGIKLEPFIECSHCHAFSKPGTPECEFCNTKLGSGEDFKVHIVAVNLGARYTPFVECPNCKKLVKVGIRRCRECYEEIPEPYAMSSAAMVVFNTVACDVANSIAAFNPFAVLVIILGIAIYLYDVYSIGSLGLFYLSLLWPATPLVMTILWFYRFGSFPLGDDEYLAAKRRMRRMLTVWLAIVSAQIIAIGIRWL